MQYRLKDATNRNNVDLLNHSNSITSGVKNIFPNARVNVHTDYFEISNLPTNMTDVNLRDMGKEIANRDAVLHGLAKEYYYTRSDGTSGKSVQLFEKF